MLNTVLVGLARVGAWEEARFACVAEGCEVLRHFSELGKPSPEAGATGWLARPGRGGLLWSAHGLRVLQ